MSVPLQDRPLETVREEVIDQLILNYTMVKSRQMPLKGGLIKHTSLIVTNR